MQVKIHNDFDEANPNGVIVTLFRHKDGLIGGWHIGPVARIDGALQVPRSSPDDRLLGAVAIVRAFELSQRLGVELSFVDPNDLWACIAGDA